MRLIGSLVGLLFLSSSIHGQVLFESVIDSTAPFPGFGSFSIMLTHDFDGSRVLFRGENDFRNDGLFIWQNGVLTEVVRSGDRMPLSGPDIFFQNRSYGNPRLFQGGALFFGTNFSDFHGFFHSTGNATVPLANTFTAVPGTSGERFQFFKGDPVVDGGRYAFIASGTTRQGDGLYISEGGVLTERLYTTEPIPGTPSDSFGSFVGLGLDGDRVMVNGSSFTEPGLYEFDEEGIGRILINKRTTPPGYEEAADPTFRAWENPVLSDGWTAFHGRVRNEVAAWGAIGLPLSVGLYLTDGNEIRTVACIRQLTACGERFTTFNRNFAFKGKSLLFLARTSFGGPENAYLWRDGQLVRVLGPGDMLDNKEVSNVFFGKNAVCGSAAALNVQFTDGSSGIYIGNTLLMKSPERNGTQVTVDVSDAPDGKTVHIRRATRLNPPDWTVIDTFVKMEGEDTRTVTVNGTVNPYFLRYEVDPD